LKGKWSEGRQGVLICPGFTVTGSSFKDLQTVRAQIPSWE
jgi:hypothetical protein